MSNIKFVRWLEMFEEIYLAAKKIAIENGANPAAFEEADTNFAKIKADALKSISGGVINIKGGQEIKEFELKNGVIQETANSQLCRAAKVIAGGYASDEGGFWALIQTVDGQNNIEGRIESPDVYDKILKAYLSKEDVMIVPHSLFQYQSYDTLI